MLFLELFVWRLPLSAGDCETGGGATVSLLSVPRNERAEVVYIGQSGSDDSGAVYCKSIGPVGVRYANMH